MSQKELLKLAVKLADKSNIITPEERAAGLATLNQALANVDDAPKWWVVLLKILAYAIGLILAGYGTTAAAQTIIHMGV